MYVDYPKNRTLNAAPPLIIHITQCCIATCCDFNLTVVYLPQSFTEYTQSFTEFFSFKEFATCGGWSLCVREILLKIKPRIIGLYKGKNPSFSKGGLCGLSAPQVLLKKLRETLRVLCETLR